MSIIAFCFRSAGVPVCSAHGRSSLTRFFIVVPPIFNLCYSPHWWAALLIAILVGCLGAIIESTLGYFGILQFRDCLLASWVCPPWLLAIRIAFAPTLQGLLGWLARRSMVASLLGGIIGQVSYYVRTILGALYFDVGYIRDQVYLNPHPKELMLRNHV